MSRPAFLECPDSRALEPTEVALGRWMLAQKPATGCGVYGASNWATSSWVSTISSDAIASTRCEGFRAPVIGAETTGLRDTHAVSYTHLDAADDLLCVDLGGRRIIKKKKKKTHI